MRDLLYLLTLWCNARNKVLCDFCYIMRYTYWHWGAWPQKNGICSQSFSGLQSLCCLWTHSSNVWNTKNFVINVTQRWWNKIITHHQHISNGYTLFIFTYYSLSNCLFSVSLFVFYFNFVLRLLIAWFSLSLSLFSFLSSFLPSIPPSLLPSFLLFCLFVSISPSLTQDSRSSLQASPLYLLVATVAYEV